MIAVYQNNELVEIHLVLPLALGTEHSTLWCADWTTEQHLSLPILTWSCRKSQLPGSGVNSSPSWQRLCGMSSDGSPGRSPVWLQAKKKPLVTADLWRVSLHPHLFLQPAPEKKRGDAGGDTLRYP